MFNKFIFLSKSQFTHTLTQSTSYTKYMVKVVDVRNVEQSGEQSINTKRDYVRHYLETTS